MQWFQLCISVAILFKFAASLNLTILHDNDVHARFLQFNKHGTACEPEEAEAKKCFGGASRRSHLVKKLKREHPNSIFLSAGDQFQVSFKFFWMKSKKGLKSKMFLRRRKSQNLPKVSSLKIMGISYHLKISGI